MCDRFFILCHFQFKISGKPSKLRCDQAKFESNTPLNW
jgi:hypothetical protein